MTGTKDTLAAMTIVLVVFLITAGLLISMMNEGMAQEQQFRSVDTLIGGTAYTEYEPTAGRAVTWANATSSYGGLPNPYAMRFWVPGNNAPISVTTVRNSTNVGGYHLPWFPEPWTRHLNYIAIEQHSWGWCDRFALSYSVITDLKNSSYPQLDTVPIPIPNFDNPDYFIIIKASSSANFTSDLFGKNAFRIFIAVLTYPTGEYGATGFWESLWAIFAAIAMLFTFNALPEVPIISYLLSGAIWMATIYIGFTFIQRAWSGG